MQSIYADFVSFLVLLTVCGFVLICQDFPFSLLSLSLFFFFLRFCVSQEYGALIYMPNGDWMVYV